MAKLRGLSLKSMKLVLFALDRKAMSTLLNPFQVLLKIETEPSQGVGAPSHQLPTNKLDRLTNCAALSGTSKVLGFIQPILGHLAMVTVLVLDGCVDE